MLYRELRHRLAELEGRTGTKPSNGEATAKGEAATAARQMVSAFDLDAVEDTVFRACDSRPSTEDEADGIDAGDSSEDDWQTKQALRQSKTLAKGALRLCAASIPCLGSLHGHQAGWYQCWCGLGCVICLTEEGFGTQCTRSMTWPPAFCTPAVLVAITAAPDGCTRKFPKIIPHTSWQQVFIVLLPL